MGNRAWSSSWGVAPVAFVLGIVAAAPAAAELTPEWITRVPVGGSLNNGVAGIVVDAAGVSYLTATTGAPNGTDIAVTAVESDGTVRWTRTWNGPEDWHDQARGIALGEGVVYVTGNTPGPGSYANVIVLGFATATGNLVRTIQYSSAPQTSEYGASVAVRGSRIFVAGGTVGDGSDALVLAFDLEGSLLWQQAWDGPAWGPYSQDNAEEVLIDPAGNPVVMIHGVMASNHPDYVVIKYEAASGNVVWQANWGVDGGDFPRDMEIDAQGDVYVTGTGIDFRDKYSTIKLRGTDGGLVWQAYDAVANDHSASALALDGQGGVFITGAADPEGDHSNFNDDFFTVKRDAAAGALLWTHRYGDPCVGCYDVPSDVIVDPAGHVFVAGSTSSPPYSSDAILLALDSATGLETDRSVIASDPGETFAFRELRFDPQFALRVSARGTNPTTGEGEMAVVKYASLAGGGISCGDLTRFVSKCTSACAGNQLQVSLALADSAYDGGQVSVRVDQQAFVVPIVGSQATLLVEGAGAGSHGVALTVPAGCFPPVTTTCPAVGLGRQCGAGPVRR